MLLQPDTCLLAYHCTYNAFFMDLTVSSVSHLSLLTAKGVDLVIACNGFHPLFIAEIIHIFIVDCRGAFRTVFDSYIMLCNGLNTAYNKE